ncbi:hypothetical protein [Pyxidicoccus xibeiensis]|uniref:hypothetical protein n=1 Tax=Pyxidicoccus xibeiensis TaxID=2906759 RepID=UPI0020A73396|nr:hypothetical protein [Pyxidicoccus xibeiensis]MCP3137352.1 hypothetical protein [Pyxidicoccus xibeiensis]
MSEGAGVGRTVIGTLRLRGAELEPLTARLRMESLLSGAHLLPAGLPPSATVCIRRLMDPKPGVMPVRGHAVRPPREWDEALASTLAAQVARAARPVQGAVPPSAEAVLFADPAELMACLASDVSRGSALAHWWWRGLFPSVDLARTVVAEWLRRPEYVPAALETVVHRREVRPVLSLFSREEARTLLAHVARVHGLTALASVRVLEEEDVVPQDTGHTGARRSSKEGGGPGASVAPWERWVPEARGTGLGVERQALLGVSMMLRRAPVETRAPSFAPAVVAWRRGGEEAPRVERPLRVSEVPTRKVDLHPVDIGSPSTPAAVRVERAQEPVRGVSAPPDPDVPSPRTERAPREEVRTGAPVSVSAGSTDSPTPPSFEAPVVVSANTEVPTGVAPAQDAVDSAPPVLPPIPSDPPRLFAPSPGHAWGLPIPTGLGGLFYLVNLGLFLELYGDFSRPSHPHLALPLWDFVTLLGRRLLVAPRPGDPVWKVLALLSRRKPGETAGHGFDPPHEWRVSGEWLLAFRSPEATTWTWAVDDGRLRVRHPEGFLVVDVTCATDSDAEAQALRETEPYLHILAAPKASSEGAAVDDALPPFTLVRGEVAAAAGGDGTPLERWLGWLVPYCRARLARALGLPLEDAAELESTLFTHDARIHLTDTHVDVVLELAQLPLAVRLAGLDRDIGWLPSAGRHLTFHFE